MTPLDEIVAAVDSPISASHVPLLVDAAGLAVILDVSLRTVRRLDEAGKLPTPLKLGSSKRWLQSEVEDWLRARAPPRRQWNSMRERT